MITSGDVHHIIAVLNSTEAEQIGLEGKPAEKFAKDPFKFFMKADQITREVITAHINKRRA